MKRALPWLVVGLILLIAVLQLRLQGRLWICSCGYVLLWSGNINSSDNSQQIFDPYTFTHILHGFMMIGTARILLRQSTWVWQFIAALSMEVLWEIIENTNFVINRYRTDTISLGYTGDSIINSSGDIAAFGLGAYIAYHLGFGRTLLLFGLIETALLIFVRDSLLLNIIMLIYPIEAIKNWQSAH